MIFNAARIKNFNIISEIFKSLNLAGVCIFFFFLDKLYKTARNCLLEKGKMKETTSDQKDSAPRALSNIESCFA